ncbi:hypothetical protein ACVWWN_006042 [Mycobacterium sp. URHB0021]
MAARFDIRAACRSAAVGTERLRYRPGVVVGQLHDLRRYASQAEDGPTRGKADAVRDVSHRPIDG